MNTPTDPVTPTPGPGPEQQALHDALAGLMASVARLGVARGLPYGAVEEMLRGAFVQAAAQAHPGLPEHRKVSRISTTTGLNRREVARLVQQQQARVPAPPARSPASSVFLHWRTHADYRHADGQPRPLPRLGSAPSFESLAQAVTRDVHPRSLLDELVRLGLAQWDAASDTVALQGEAFVDTGDLVRQLGYLGHNVGDHLQAAVENVLGGSEPLHLEQAVSAHGLSAASIALIRPAVRAQWQSLLAALVPLLEARVAADGQLQPPPEGRFRVGLYAYQAGAEPPAPPPPPAPPARAKRKDLP